MDGVERKDQTPLSHAVGMRKKIFMLLLKGAIQPGCCKVPTGKLASTDTLLLLSIPSPGSKGSMGLGKGQEPWLLVMAVRPK